jgi:hypothetical protein
MTSLGVILITGAVLGLVFLLWLVLEGEQTTEPFLARVDGKWWVHASGKVLEVPLDENSATYGPGYDPTEGIQPPDVYPDDLRGSH